MAEDSSRQSAFAASADGGLTSVSSTATVFISPLSMITPFTPATSAGRTPTTSPASYRSISPADTISYKESRGEQHHPHPPLRVVGLAATGGGANAGIGSHQHTAPRRLHQFGLSLSALMRPRTPPYVISISVGRGWPGKSLSGLFANHNTSRRTSRLLLFVAMAATMCFVYTYFSTDLIAGLGHNGDGDASLVLMPLIHDEDNDDANTDGGVGRSFGRRESAVYSPPNVLDGVRRPSGTRFANYKLPDVETEFRGAKVPIPDPIASIPVHQPVERAKAQAEMIKSEMKAAFAAYERYAWGHDELKPVSNTYHDWGTGPALKGMGLTAVDSLSTLWIMGLEEEFYKSMKLATEEVDYSQNMSASTFEYTIRYIGGLLSAYELSGESYPKLLSTAAMLMDKLLVAYNTSTGLPHQTVNLKSLEHYAPSASTGEAILSEFGTVQLELRTLSYHTKNPVYDIKATHITDIMESQCARFGGLCPTMFKVDDAAPTNLIFTYGSNSDSYYEYLLKQYILTGGTEERYKFLALEALDEGIAKLLGHSPINNFAYFEKIDAQLKNPVRDNKMEHLTCFAGGMYAMAGRLFNDYGHASLYGEIGKRITQTCFNMYQMQEIGLSSEAVIFRSISAKDKKDMANGRRHNFLRPEAVESIFYMWRYTKDQKYRDMAWEIFKSFYRYSKTPNGGYTGLKMVNWEDVLNPSKDDMMQSFFLSETLKYLYLIFSEDEVLDLDSWVLNTEAHPLKIRARDPLDVWREWEVHHSGVPAFMPPTVPGVKIRTETERMQVIRKALGGVIRASVDPMARPIRSG